MDSCLYVASNLGAATTVTEAGLSETTQRHRLAIRLGPLATCLDPLGEIAKRPDLLGVIVAMERGWPGSSHLRFASSVLRQRRRIWFYWPSEQAIECVDTDVLAGYWRLWTVCTADRLKRRLTGLGFDTKASGAFDVKMTPQKDEGVGDATIGRMTIIKQ